MVCGEEIDQVVREGSSQFGVAIGAVRDEIDVVAERNQSVLVA